MTPKGVIDRGGTGEMQKEHVQYLKENYITYDYWYTVTLECNHQVSIDNMPEKISDILHACHLDHEINTVRDSNSYPFV